MTDGITILIKLEGENWEEWFVEGVYVLDEATRKAIHLGGKHLPVPGDPDSCMTPPDVIEKGTDAK